MSDSLCPHGLQLARFLCPWDFPGNNTEVGCHFLLQDIYIWHKRHRFNPWVVKIPWSRKWLPTPVFLPGKSHGQRSLAGYSPWGCKELDITEHVHMYTHRHAHTHTHIEKERWRVGGRQTTKLLSLKIVPICTSTTGNHNL